MKLITILILKFLLYVNISQECEYDVISDAFNQLQTGYSNRNACSNSLTRWQTEGMFIANEEQCSCLVGLSTHIIESFDCSIQDNTLLEWKTLCGSKFCTVDNPAEFCHCNQDELRNEWSTGGNDVFDWDMGKSEVEDLCSAMIADWNNGEHIYSATPSVKSCRCLTAIPSQGLDLGCKWSTDDFSRPWEKSPSMASIASKCQNMDKSLLNAEDDYDFVDIKAITSHQKSFETLSEPRTTSSSTTGGVLMKALVAVTVLIIVALIIHKCYFENPFDQQRKERKNMTKLPTQDDLDEFGLESDEDIEMAMSPKAIPQDDGI